MDSENCDNSAIFAIIAANSSNFLNASPTCRCSKLLSIFFRLDVVDVLAAALRVVEGALSVAVAAAAWREFGKGALELVEVTILLGLCFLPKTQGNLTCQSVDTLSPTLFAYI